MHNPCYLFAHVKAAGVDLENIETNKDWLRKWDIPNVAKGKSWPAEEGMARIE